MTFILFLAAAVAAPLPAEAPAAQPAPFAAAASLDETTLAASTAREDVAQIATATQTAQVSNNSVNGNSRTGEVGFDGNAFQNFSGLGIVNANSGNNVGINAAITVNVTITPR